jgi:hypothetical protein
MKNILLILALALSLGAQAQRKLMSEMPFKKANGVLIATSDSALVALKKVGSTLIQQGYTIKNFDKDFFTILTEPKDISKPAYPTSIVVRAAAVPEGVALTAEFTMDLRVISPTSERVVRRVECTGKEPKGLFLSLVNIAKAYPNGQVKYIQQ